MGNQTTEQKQQPLVVDRQETWTRAPSPARVGKIARRFSSHMRPWIAGVIAVDTTGRLAQMVETCPGALIFAFALLFHDRARTGQAGCALLRDAVAGRPLDDLLDAALERWAENARHLVAAWHRGGHVGRCICDRVVEAVGPARKRLLHAQRLLIRRAVAGVKESSIWLPPPVAFEPEDIPSEPSDNRAWFDVVKLHAAATVEHTGDVSSQIRGLSAFVSRNALVVKKRTPVYQRSRQYRALLNYASATGEFPSRTTSASRYLDKVERWHHRIARAVQASGREQRAGRPPVAGDLRGKLLPKAPCPGWRSDDNRILPLRTVAELVAEETRMRNRGAGYVGEAMAGLAVVYHADIAGKGLTIVVAPDGRGYRLVDATAFGNAEPTRAQKRVLGEFLKHFRRDARVGKTKCGCSCHSTSAANGFGG
jgi:hypothetical protein